MVRGFILLLECSKAPNNPRRTPRTTPLERLVELPDHLLEVPGLHRVGRGVVHLRHDLAAGPPARTTGGSPPGDRSNKSGSGRACPEEGAGDAAGEAQAVVDVEVCGGEAAKHHAQERAAKVKTDAALVCDRIFPVPKARDESSKISSVSSHQNPASVA